MTRNIDELSNLTTQKAEPPKEYFGKMDLNEEQVEKRLQYTEKANELFDVILILLLTMNERGETNFFYAKSLLESWILSLVAEFTTPDDYLMDYATDTAYNFVDTTNKHIDEPWYTSSDRALYNAENGANDVLNYTEYKEAIEAGKTEKRWITEKDNRVRKSHKAVTQKPIPILEYFRVGMAQMRFPKDYELAAAFPEELINCRCTIEYLPKNERKTQSGAISGALNDENDPLGLKRDAKAQEMYEEIRNRDKNFEIKAVSKNSGFSESEIERVYNHIFIRKHLLDDGVIDRFAPDFYMANSWLRLRNGKKIYPHDITMINHELVEEKILGDSIEISARMAHNIANQQYNYKNELLKFLKNHNG